MKKILLTILSLVVALSVVKSVFASNDRLPETMVGQTTATMRQASNNTSLKFDGNDSVNLGNPDKIKNISGSMTVEFWYKYDGPGSDPGNYGWYGVLNKNTGGSGYSDPFLFFIGPGSNGTHSMNLRTADGTTNPEKQMSVLNLSDNSFHQVAYVFNYTTHELKLFIDGNLKSSITLNSAEISRDWKPIMNSAYNVNIGFWAASYFNGKFDELRIYNRALGDGEVAQSYVGSYDNGLSLVGHWDFNRNLDDSSANPADPGTLGTALYDSTPYGPTKTYYGGFTGNQAVYNYTNDATNPSGGSGQMLGKKLNPSAVFNGTDSYIDAGQAPDILGTDPFAISMWVKRNRTSPYLPYSPASDWKNNEYIFSQAANGYGDAVLFFQPDDKVAFRIYGTSQTDANGHCNTYINSGSTIIPYNDNNWHHIVALRDNIDPAQGQLWIDGINVTNDIKWQANTPVEMKMWTQGVGTTAINTNIGRLSFEDGGNKYGYFKGNISTVRTYNQALDPTNVSNLYQENQNVPTDNLKAFWMLNNGNDVITDSSDNGYDATFVNSGAAAGWIDDGPIPYNPASATDYGYNLFGFDKTTLTDCIDDNLLGGIYNCFISSTRNSNVKVMSSRTYVNKDPATAVMELAALYYSPNATLSGDAYLGDIDPNNFSYWGRNLTQGSGTATNPDSFWSVNNANAQASFSGDEFVKYAAKIKELQGEAASAIASHINNGPPVYLQSDNINSAPASSAVIDNYPNGKVWVVNGNITISSAHPVSYYGIGTIIINGNLTINSGGKITAADSSSKLGIIVLGNVTISGNNTVESAILAGGSSLTGGDFVFSGNNVNLIGSFVAKGFTNLNARSNIRFYYDRRLDSAWPPGFRDLKMPHASEN